MSRNYKFQNLETVYFVGFAVVVRKDIKSFIAIDFLAEKGVKEFVVCK